MSRFHREGTQVFGLEFAPDGKSLFEGERNGRITQRDLPAGTVRREFNFPDPAGSGSSTHRPVFSMTGLNQMKVSPDGSVLARALNDDERIGLWDVPSGRWIDWLDSDTAEPAVIDFSPDGTTLVAQHADKCVLWDMRTRQPRRTIATESFFPAVRFSSDGAVIARGALGCIQVIDADTGRVLSENNVPATAGRMAFHPGGSVLFASAPLDSTIRLWDTRTGRELLSLQGHTGLIGSLVLTPDGNTLVSTDQAGTVLGWDLAHYNGHIQRELEYRASHGAGP